MQSFEEPSPLERDIADLMGRFLAAECSFEYVRKRCGNGWREDPEFSGKIAALGVKELFEEETAAGLAELSRIAELGGGALLPEALTEHILCGALLKRFASENGGAPAVPSGDGVCATSDCSYRISKGRLSCELPFVYFGQAAHYLVVLGNDGAVFLVEAVQPQKVTRVERSLDLTRPLTSIRLENAACVALEDSLASRICRARELLSCSELVGILLKVFEQTREYVKTRTQFSRPIGSFQAVQHSMADMQVMCAAAQSLLSFVRWSYRAAPSQTDLALDSLSLFLRRHAVSCVQRAIQLFGGIGFTWEAPLHFYLRRVRAIIALGEASRGISTRLLRSVDVAATV